MFSGFVFDMDGVLMDTESLQFDAWVEVLEGYGVEFPGEDYHLYAGLPADVIVGMLNEGDAGLPVEKVVCERKAVARRLLGERPIKMMAEARRTLDFLRAGGFPLAVASGGLRREVESKIRAHGLKDYFKCVVAGDDVEKGKPFPDIYERAVGGLGLRPGVCLAFEDTSVGVQAAVSAGCSCVAVPTCLSEKQDFSLAMGVFTDLWTAVSSLPGFF